MECLKVKFPEVSSVVPKKPGLYEIYTNDGLALKVGISNNLRRRLLQHFASRQKSLKLRVGGNWSNPDDVVSKSSILAKHLYFSNDFHEYDLKTEDGRKLFLEKSCFIIFTVTRTRDEARVLEKAKESEAKFKFVGKADISSIST